MTSKQYITITVVVFFTVFAHAIATAVDAKKPGILDGQHQTYYDNGKMQSVSTYVQGIKHGIAKEYYEHGMLKSEVRYHKGKRLGEMKEYYPGGELMRTSQYLNDKLDGLQTKYYRSGKLWLTREYAQGKSTGYGVTSYTYYLDGSVESEYVWNKDDGAVRKEYHTNGQVALQMKIHPGGATECWNYDMLGEFISTECPPQ